MNTFSENGNDFVGRLLHEGGVSRRTLSAISNRLNIEPPASWRIVTPRRGDRGVDRGSAAVAGDLGVGGLAMGRFGVASGVALYFQ